MLQNAALFVLMMAIWFGPPLLTKLDAPHPCRRAASLSALLLGFFSLALIGWLRYGWSRDLLPFMGATALYCGLVLLFTLEFLRHADKQKDEKAGGKR
jgi:hypothetical protein